MNVSYIKMDVHKHINYITTVLFTFDKYEFFQAQYTMTVLFTFHKYKFDYVYTFMTKQYSTIQHGLFYIIITLF